MSHPTLLQTLLFALALAFLSGCLSSADRENPIDPQSDKFQNVGTLAGQTFSFFAPFRPVPDVEVRLSPGSMITFSDQDGRFVFGDVTPGKYRIKASKSGFAPAEDSISIEFLQTVPHQFNLDALPLFDSVSVRSRHIRNTFPTPDIFFLEVSANVDDPDGKNDIALVELQMPALGFADTLQATATLGKFMSVIFASQLPTSQLEGVLGRPFFLTASDGEGASTESEATFLPRIISQAPQPDSPNGFVLLNDPNPVLNWTGSDLPFEFTYRVEVVRTDLGVETSIWTRSNLTQQTTSVRVDLALAPGIYLWTVAVVDVFDNWSESVQASFRINQ